MNSLEFRSLFCYIRLFWHSPLFPNLAFPSFRDRSKFTSVGLWAYRGTPRPFQSYSTLSFYISENDLWSV